MFLLYSSFSSRLLYFTYYYFPPSVLLFEIPPFALDVYGDERKKKERLFKKLPALSSGSIQLISNWIGLRL